MLQRNLLYTGVTHGKRLVVLVGQRKAIAIAVHNVSGRRRWSKLKEWLRAASDRSPPMRLTPLTQPHRPVTRQASDGPFPGWLAPWLAPGLVVTRDCRKFWGLRATRAFSRLSTTWGETAFLAGAAAFFKMGTGFLATVAPFFTAAAFMGAAAFLLAGAAFLVGGITVSSQKLCWQPARSGPIRKTSADASRAQFESALIGTAYTQVRRGLRFARRWRHARTGLQNL